MKKSMFCLATAILTACSGTQQTDGGVKADSTAQRVNVAPGMALSDIPGQQIAALDTLIYHQVCAPDTAWLFVRTDLGVLWATDTYFTGNAADTVAPNPDTRLTYRVEMPLDTLRHAWHLDWQAEVEKITTIAQTVARNPDSAPGYATGALLDKLQHGWRAESPERSRTADWHERVTAVTITGVDSPHGKVTYSVTSEYSVFEDDVPRTHTSRRSSWATFVRQGNTFKMADCATLYKMHNATPDGD